MRCVKCGCELNYTADDFSQQLCSSCKLMKQSEEYANLLQGWICPRCGQAWSPFEPQCNCTLATIKGSLKIK